MVLLSVILRTGKVTTSRELYKHLLRECKRLPKDASEFYKHSIKQSFKQHVNETDPERIKQIIDRALENAAWVMKKAWETVLARCDPIPLLPFLATSKTYTLLCVADELASMLWRSRRKAK